MVINYTFDFIDKFFHKPLPIILFETKRGAVDVSKAYTNYLAKYGIKPSLIANFKNQVTIKELKIFGGGYILLTAGAERLKKKDVNVLRELNDNFEVYYDFPFEISPLDLPYLRTYDSENQWYWDMFNAGIPLYDKNPCGYVEGCFKHNGWVIKNGALVMNNISSMYVNIKGGIRKTLQPEIEHQNSIYILGACIAYGDRSDDNRTIASALQYRINKGKYPYKVYNLGVNNATIQNSLQILKTLNIGEGDFIFFVDAARTMVVEGEGAEELFIEILKKMNDYCVNNKAYFVWLNCPGLTEIKKKSNLEIQQLEKRYANTIETQREYIKKIHVCGFDRVKPYKGVNKISMSFSLPDSKVVNSNKAIQKCLTYGIRAFDLAQVYERPHEFIEIFTDAFHIGYMGYAMIADFIYRTWVDKKQATTCSEKCYEDLLNKFIHNDEIDRFINQLKEEARDKPQNVGAIVMNCNPFTFGHRYLIETAIKSVEYLYIFVVEEDLSEFSFRERLAMVKEGVNDLENVNVLPSGKFVISSISFPEYFTKEQNSTNSFDASGDLEFFSTKVAPALNITKRFVGQEPFDITTNEYNRQMKKILGRHGIDVVEIPRLEDGGNIINATQVRKWMLEGDYERIKKFVPDSTYNVVRKHMELKEKYKGEGKLS